ncbi:hypothetical protein DL96DRAFT_1811681 [Flagelloscypha sp. PMI_526]|nr:hypothetical protein DL96DRAFT_1811681 [Flagelloscypha sp. PMI_526]
MDKELVAERIIFACQNPACNFSTDNKSIIRTCGGCRSSSYCSRECQKTHWPSHKVICKLNQSSRAITSGQSPATPKGKQAIYVPPSQNPSKVMEDLGKWVKHHRTWLSHCVYYAGQLRRFANRRGSAGPQDAVHIEVEVHDTHRKSYTFTFKKAYTVPLKSVLDAAQASSDPGSREGLIAHLSGTQTKSDMLRTVAVLSCEGMIRTIPHYFHWRDLESIGQDNPDINEETWPLAMHEVLMAPVGCHPSVMSKLSKVWLKNGRAWRFCCVNLLKLKRGMRTLPDLTVQFDWTYEYQGPLADIEKNCKLIPFPPVAKPATGQTKNVRAVEDGFPGTRVSMTACIVGTPVIGGKCWISDAELESIEVRDDWKYHFYTLLQGYDLAD